MLPVRELLGTERYVSAVHALIEGGIEPVRRFLSILRNRSATSDPIDAGILPARELTMSARCFSSVIALIESGIEPVRKLLLTSII